MKISFTSKSLLAVALGGLMLSGMSTMQAVEVKSSGWCPVKFLCDPKDLALVCTTLALLRYIHKDETTDCSRACLDDVTNCMCNPSQITRAMSNPVDFITKCWYFIDDVIIGRPGCDNCLQVQRDNKVTLKQKTAAQGLIGYIDSTYSPYINAKIAAICATCLCLDKFNIIDMKAMAEKLGITDVARVAVKAYAEAAK